MALHRGIDGSEPVRPEPITRLGGTEEERRAARSRVMAVGSLACPGCDAPVAPLGAMAPADPIACPFCTHTARVRDFLTLGEPTRPAYVTITIR